MTKPDLPLRHLAKEARNALLKSPRLGTMDTGAWTQVRCPGKRCQALSSPANWLRYCCSCCLTHARCMNVFHCVDETSLPEIFYFSIVFFCFLIAPLICSLSGVRALSCYFLCCFPLVKFQFCFAVTEVIWLNIDVTGCCRLCIVFPWLNEAGALAPAKSFAWLDRKPEWIVSGRLLRTGSGHHCLI